MKESLLSLRCGWFLPSARLGSIGKRHLNLIAAFLLTLPLLGQAEPLRILVAGDGRAEYPWQRCQRDEDVNGINVKITTEIAQAVLDEKAQIMLWTGDMANINERDPDKRKALKKKLMAWRDIMQRLYDKNIAVLAVRGNHEVEWHQEKDWTPIKIPGAREVWNEVFSGRYALPDNGPQSEKYLSFFYPKGPVLCIGLDEYERPEKTPHYVDQQWLDKVLNDEKRPFIFAYSHEPAFMAGRHAKQETLAVVPEKRDRMWKSLYKAGARAYFCGHDHFYDHMEVQSDMTPKGMHQFLAGTAGAPFYDAGGYAEELGWNLTRIKHQDRLWGYILIVVDEGRATITFKGRSLPGKYEEMDSWSYTPEIP